MHKSDAQRLVQSCQNRGLSFRIEEDKIIIENRSFESFVAAEDFLIQVPRIDQASQLKTKGLRHD